jgi:hypothetical protein
VKAVYICLTAWALAAAAQIGFVASLSGRVASQAADLLVQQFVFIAIGLILAVTAYAYKRWRAALVTGASALYLLHWFPWKSVSKVGPVATGESMLALASTPSLRLMFLLRDVILPVAFIIAIAFAVVQMSQRRAGTIATRSS